MNVHSLWIGERLSNLSRLALASYIANGHTFKMWTYAPLENVPPGVEICNGNEIIPYSDYHKYPTRAQFADWFRWNLLYQHGGWWVDADMVDIRPLPDPGDNHVFAQEANWPKIHLDWHFEVDSNEFTLLVNNDILYAPKGSEVMEYCIEQVKAKPNKSSLLWVEIGPMLLTGAMNKFELRSCVQPGIVFNPFLLTELVSPTLEYEEMELGESATFMDLFDSKTLTVHLWNTQWDGHRWDKDKLFPDNCIYGRLQRHYLPELIDPEETNLIESLMV